MNLYIPGKFLFSFLLPETFQPFDFSDFAPADIPWLCYAGLLS